MNSRHGTYPPSRYSTRIDGRLYGTHFTTNDRDHETRIDLFIAHEPDISRLNHCIGGLDHSHETHALNHSKSFHNPLAKKSKLLPPECGENDKEDHKNHSGGCDEES